MTDSRRPGWVITFYSYKGGVGRTFVLANVATLLARWGQRVLCIDWDLEAPGLATYLLPEGAPPPARGLAHLMQAVPATRTFDERDHVTRVDAGHGATFDLLAAGNGDPAYAAIVQGLDWSELYARHGLGDALEAARARWRQDYDVVLIDSRTGYADTSGICTIQLPDCVIAVATATRQSFDGLAQVLEHVHHQRSELLYERGRLLVVPLLNRFDGATEVQLGEQWTGRFRDTFMSSIEGWLHRGLVEKGRLAEFVPRLRVPQVAYWNFGERLPVAQPGASDPGAMVRALEDIASLLEHRLESTDRLLDDRDAYVRESRHRRSPFHLDVLVVPLGELDARVKLVERLLQEGGHRVHVEAQPDHATVAGSRTVLLVNNGNGDRAIRTRNAVQKAFWASLSEESTGEPRRVEEVSGVTEGDIRGQFVQLGLLADGEEVPVRLFVEHFPEHQGLVGEVVRLTVRRSSVHFHHRILHRVVTLGGAMVRWESAGQDLHIEYPDPQRRVETLSVHGKVEGSDLDRIALARQLATVGVPLSTLAAATKHL
jgi:cellulose biosynthesis protein BcsQ